MDEKEAFEKKIQTIEKGGDSNKVMECFSDLVRLNDCIYLIKDIEIPFDNLEDLPNLETHSDEIPLLKNDNFTTLNNSPDIDNYSLDEFLTEREDLTDFETSSYTDETHPEINNELLENIKNSNDYSSFYLKLIKESCLES